MKKIPLILLLFSFFLLGERLCEPALAKTPSEKSSLTPKYKKKYSGAPLRGKSYYSYGKGKRLGAYSYKYAQGINTRKFTDPTLNGQNAFGPLESDFFFSTPRPQIGGDSPYLH